MAQEYIQPAENGVRLFVRLSPRAKREGIEDIYTDADGRERLKIAVNAPPVDGKANQELIKLLAKLFRLPKGVFEITVGQTDRNKTLVIAGNPKELSTKITEEVGKCLK